MFAPSCFCSIVSARGCLPLCPLTSPPDAAPLPRSLPLSLQVPKDVDVPQGTTRYRPALPPLETPNSPFDAAVLTRWSSGGALRILNCRLLDQV